MRGSGTIAKFFQSSQRARQLSMVKIFKDISVRVSGMKKIFFNFSNVRCSSPKKKIVSSRCAS